MVCSQLEVSLENTPIPDHTINVEWLLYLEALMPVVLPRDDENSSDLTAPVI